MRIKYLSGPLTGQQEDVEGVAGEQMCQFGYAERVPDVPPQPAAPLSPALVQEPPADDVDDPAAVLEAGQPVRPDEESAGQSDPV